MNRKLTTFSFAAITTTFIPILDRLLIPLLTQFPEWGPVWGTALGLYSLYLFYEQDKLNEVIEFIQKHPDKFTQNIISSSYFRSSFLKFLGDYLKQYNYDKRQVLKKILLENLSEETKTKYEIDRLNNVLSQISLEAMANLVWINKEILPILNNEVEHELLVYKDAKDPREKNRLSDVTRARKNISTYVSSWIHNNYDPNSDKVKREKGYNDQWNEQEKMKFNKERWLEKHEVEKSKYIHWSEYVSLGIMIAITEDSGIGGGAGTVYKLTEFGEQFIKYLIDERN